LESTSWIEIDLGAIDRNVSVLRRALEPIGAGEPPSICAVLKADGYGLGAVRLAKRLAGAGVEMLAVYTPEQARELVDAAVGLPILVLMPVRSMGRDDRLYRAASRGLLHLTVHDAGCVDGVEQIADRLGLELPVHLFVDTGMTRCGAPMEDCRGLARRIMGHPRLRLAGVCSHLSSADCDDDLTRTQSEAFGAWVESMRLPSDCMVHLSNSYGVFRSRDLHAGMVRTGLALLGYSVEEFDDLASFELAGIAMELEHSVRWCSRVVQVKDIAPNTPVGYGATWRSSRPTRIATVPVGYADGYPLALSNEGKVGVRLDGERAAYAPLVGRVSMDQITIDVTDLRDAVGIGTTVDVVGTDRDAPNALPALAAQAGTITHELLCRLSARLPRKYSPIELRPVVAATSEIR
jgi:alanine racemase